MTRPACLLKTDLSLLRLVTDGEVALWTAPPDQPDADPVAVHRARADAAAEWLRSRVSARRLSLACLDIDETTCAWVRAPSTEPAVLAAAIRAGGQDWGDRLLTSGLQPLVDPETPSRRPLFQRRSGTRRDPAPTAVPKAILVCPDALARLWLDRLDAQGITFDSVASLWHALAAAWSPPATNDGQDSPVTASILIEATERAVWVWSRGSDILAGGQAMLDRPAQTRSAEGAPGATESSAEPDPAARLVPRLALDWLTWSTQLGATPARAVVVGPGGRELGRTLADRWPHLTVEAVDERDPLDATIRRAAAASSAGPQAGPRRAYTTLTNRPTRSLRAQYLWAGAALLLVSVAFMILGLRFGRAAEAMRTAADDVRAQAVSVVEVLDDPTLARANNVEKVLDSRLAELKRRPPISYPPVPRPLHDEFRRALDVLTKYEGVRIVQFNLDARSSGLLVLTVPSRRTGEEILQALQAASEAVSWSLAGPGSSADQSLRLNANWIR